MTRLSDDALAAIKERDNGAVPDDLLDAAEADEAFSDRHALLAHIAALEAELSDARDARVYLERLWKNVAPQCVVADKFVFLATQFDNLIAGERQCISRLRNVVYDYRNEWGETALYQTLQPGDLG